MLFFCFIFRNYFAMNRCNIFQKDTLHALLKRQNFCKKSIVLLTFAAQTLYCIILSTLMNDLKTMLKSLILSIIFRLLLQKNHKIKYVIISKPNLPPSTYFDLDWSLLFNFPQFNWTWI